MGATMSVFGGEQPEAAADPWAIPPNYKNPYWAQPETPFDALPVQEHPQWANDLPRFSTSAFRERASACSGKEACEPGTAPREHLLQCMRERGFVVLRMSAEEKAAVSRLYDTMREFFAHSVAEKQSMAPPQRIDGQRTQFSGYSQIHFDNRNNRRDPEYRDVFQVRPGEPQSVPWPEGFAMEEHAMAVYENMWTTACTSPSPSMVVFLSLLLF
eukprot:TRINITY_DN1063_c0_g1_i1.p1 TRINITY_DN1063_c0_g1~~TRINITY_DN1063_c0_g1_i1.p1  ORF type:complete len:214 (+),score=44.59 TRINITY_DN1063_c0_g1_i1:110-751(+)